MPRLTIDGLEIEVPEGTKVIEAAERLGIMIPRFCYHKGLGAVGACRMCAVKFLQGPFKGVQMSCMIDAQDGMVVSTTDEEAVAFRKQVIEWLMLNHPHDCPVCDEGGHCLLQDETVSGGHGIRRYEGKKRTYRDQDLGPFIRQEMNRCIHCYRCVRFYKEFAGYRDFGVMQSANRVFYGRFQEGPLESPFSGNLADLCPTGVYTDRTARYRARRWDLQRAPSICVHCSLGCNTVGNARYRDLLRLEARPNERVNGFFICDRGRFGHGFASLPERPRGARIGGGEVPVDEAIQECARELSAIMDKYGPSSVACWGSTRCTMESLAMLKGLSARLGWRPPVFFGTEAEQGATLSAVSAVHAFDGTLSVSLKELEKADCILVIGADPINEAPMLALSLRQSVRNEGSVMVLDPRPVALPFVFDHLPVDAASLGAVAWELVHRAILAKGSGAMGAEAAPEHVKAASEASSGKLDPEGRSKLEAWVAKLSRSRFPAVVCGTSVAPVSLPAMVGALAHSLGVAVGKCGFFAVFSGPNAHGAALAGAAPLRGAETLVEEIERGEVRALLVMENDPLWSFPDRVRLEKALEKLELLLVMDYVPSLTVAASPFFLPTVPLFESGGLLINQEGRIQYARVVHETGMPVRQVNQGSHPPRDYAAAIPGADPSPAWRILWRLGMELQVEGLPVSEEDLWPFTASEIPALGEWREGGYASDGWLVDAPDVDAQSTEIHEMAGLTELTNSDAPGQSIPAIASHGSYRLHLVDWTFGTEELSRYAPVMGKVEGEPFLAMHPSDASMLSLSDGNEVELLLVGGSLQVPVRLFENMCRGTLILPKHRGISWQRAGGLHVTLSADRMRRV